MFFAARIPIGRLAALCHRLAISLESGIDMRTVWRREADHARGRAARRSLSAISEHVERGSTLSDALADTGEYFPLLFRELVEVGEQSGHLSEVMAQLHEHYQNQIRLRRAFLGSIAWPMLQLSAAVLIIGVLIWAMGIINQITGQNIDILGFGLVGNRGLAIYAAGVAGVVAALAILVRAVRRGVFWTRPIQRLVLRVPVLGPALQTMALARLAWSLHLTMHAGMRLQRAITLSLRSTQNARYTDQVEVIDREIAAGNSIYEAFYATGVFPVDFLDSLHVGEQSGRLVESMAILSRQYQEHARLAVATLTMLAGFAVWAIVGVILVALIFRLFSFYVGAINDAARI